LLTKEEKGRGIGFRFSIIAKKDGMYERTKSEEKWYGP
jgi:hypothetical protein